MRSVRRSCVGWGRLPGTAVLRPLGSRVLLSSSRSLAQTSGPLASCSTPSKSDETFVNQLITNYKPGWSLHQPFYTSDAVYRVDLAKVWSNSWLFAGFSFQVQRPGDYFTYEVEDDSIIVTRDESGKLQALYNVCKHRGSRICLKEAGYSTRLVCPYHQWTYGLDGQLLRAKYMEQDDFKVSDVKLDRAKVEEIDGLIWISLSNNPPDFEECRGLLSSELKPHGIQDAKVAFTTDYTIKANWKLVYENNRDCYHCNVGHPEYIQANYDTAYIYVKNADGTFSRQVDPKHPQRAEIEAYIEEKTKTWQQLGLQSKCSPASSFPGAGWYRASRTPNRKGWVTESIDGKPVAPLMGSFKYPDMGSMRIHTLPNFWIHASSDHAVATRLTPSGIQETKARVWWLVHKDAQEGKDYDLAHLLPLWKNTSEQDWRLCEDNQLGVNSRGHTPGKFSVAKEAGVDKFVQWYMKKIGWTPPAK
jgi:Rieske 2Fe-2S family protein